MTRRSDSGGQLCLIFPHSVQIVEHTQTFLANAKICVVVYAPVKVLSFF